MSNGRDFLRNARERAEHGCVTSWRNADGNGEWRDKTLPEISALAAIGRRDLAHRSLGA